MNINNNIQESSPHGVPAPLPPWGSCPRTSSTAISRNKIISSSSMHSKSVKTQHAPHQYLLTQNASHTHPRAMLDAPMIHGSPKKVSDAQTVESSPSRAWWCLVPPKCPLHLLQSGQAARPNAVACGRSLVLQAVQWRVKASLLAQTVPRIADQQQGQAKL